MVSRKCTDGSRPPSNIWETIACMLALAPARVEEMLQVEPRIPFEVRIKLESMALVVILNSLWGPYTATEERVLVSGLLCSEASTSLVNPRHQVTAGPAGRPIDKRYC